MLTAAVRNNADWCAAVCRSHGIPSSFGPTAWHSARRTPTYYPDAITLDPAAVPADFLSEIDTASGCSVKDSFGTLDLTAHGFTELFSAEWMHRPAGQRPPASTLRAERVGTAEELAAWQRAWQHGDGPDVFRPALLHDPEVRVLAVRAGAELAGGVVLNRGAGVVGLSNLFAVDGVAVAEVWAAAIGAADPGLPLVGYEHGDDLAPALASGFTTLGPLRVWLAG